MPGALAIDRRMGMHDSGILCDGRGFETDSTGKDVDFVKANEITIAAKSCRAAFAEVNVGDVVQHCHHEKWLEILTEPAANRIDYILSNKATHEQAERLRRFRPFKLEKAYAELEKAFAEREKAYAEREKADAELEKAGSSPAMLKLHAEICGCPWSASTDIFGNAR